MTSGRDIRVVVKQHPVVSYYVVTFAISWGAILILVGPSGFLSTTAASPSFALVGLASLLGPGIAGILLTGVVDGRTGLRQLLSRLLRWRVGLRWYALALMTAPLVTTTVLLTLSLTSAAFLPAIVTADDKASLLLLGLVAGLVVPAFEELGWTGFATPHLRSHHSVLATGLIMGVLWGAWHLPLFAGSAASTGEISPPLFMAAMLFSWLLPYRVLMVWLYDRTQSLLVVMLMHLPIVVDQWVLNAEAMSPEQRFVSLLANAAALWLVVVVLAVLHHGRLTVKEVGATEEHRTVHLI